MYICIYAYVNIYMYTLIDTHLMRANIVVIYWGHIAVYEIIVDREHGNSSQCFSALIYPNSNGAQSKSKVHMAIH